MILDRLCRTFFSPVGVAVSRHVGAADRLDMVAGRLDVVVGRLDVPVGTVFSVEKTLASVEIPSWFRMTPQPSSLSLKGPSARLAGTSFDLQAV